MSSWQFAEGDEIAPGRSVLRPLGGGTDYEVLLVWEDARFAIMVAKLLRPHLAGDERALRHLRREAEALARLQHPVLVRGFGAVLDGPHPHLVLEHLEGWTLRAVIKRGGPLPLEQLLPLALHVAAALHYLHGEGWVHLDVKPANVVMGVPPRLIDLSVARPVEDAARLSTPLGTDAYMAPEQCDPGRLGPVGPPADVFGLGATLHHALAGAVPFPRGDDEERFPQLRNAPAALPRRTPEALVALVAAALDPDPAARPTAAELALALEPLVEGLPRRRVGKR